MTVNKGQIVAKGRKKRILVINGPNINMLGEREPEIYGYCSLEQIETELQSTAEQAGFTVTCRQSNNEGEIVDWLQDCRRGGFAGLIINPAAYSHYSVAILDALIMVPIPVIEIHISNIFQREGFRRELVTARAADAVMMGFGPAVYYLALTNMIDMLTKEANWSGEED